ncbi:hypothetical protein EVAR_70603_1 [Eumeta japonica]|uniref:Uncharacterized protein n=1 Tax=Eumeta variegata TaxID=151549 RepID=A0A4C1SR87_EUMVA|nr:hypothetical protein EVAR_70603_1 [Eumeta japonica]
MHDYAVAWRKVAHDCRANRAVRKGQFSDCPFLTPRRPHSLRAHQTHKYRQHFSPSVRPSKAAAALNFRGVREHSARKINFGRRSRASLLRLDVKAANKQSLSGDKATGGKQRIRNANNGRAGTGHPPIPTQTFESSAAPRQVRPLTRFLRDEHDIPGQIATCERRSTLELCPVCAGLPVRLQYLRLRAPTQSLRPPSNYQMVLHIINAKSSGNHNSVAMNEARVTAATRRGCRRGCADCDKRYVIIFDYIHYGA